MPPPPSWNETIGHSLPSYFQKIDKNSIWNSQQARSKEDQENRVFPQLWHLGQVLTSADREAKDLDFSVFSTKSAVASLGEYIKLFFTRKYPPYDKGKREKGLISMMPSAAKYIWQFYPFYHHQISWGQKPQNFCVLRILIKSGIAIYLRSLAITMRSSLLPWDSVLCPLSPETVVLASDFHLSPGF